jgi:L-alanine-DL-glutamate epimerase-like enolase superfamily enzyme
LSRAAPGTLAAAAADPALQPVRLDAHVLRYPIAAPVRTSFGVMHDRPAVLLRVEDADGAHGWGEVWCNYPACGAEHRARLVESVFAPLLCGARFDSPREAFSRLQAATEVLALQTGEHGPIAQAIAGIDLALWDLVARRAGQPLWRLLGGASDTVTVYASGINPDEPARMVERKRTEGYRAFKLKVGFGLPRDLDNIAAVREVAGPGASVMIDANQAWDLPAALDLMPRLEPFALAWIEEPLRADRPWRDWRTLRAQAPAPLAAGENVAGEAAFAALVDAGAVQVVQPDAAKWGGVSGVLPIAHLVRRACLRYCPHYLGAGIGLLHSAHLLAAAGGDGLLEVDANENPLRSLLCGPVAHVQEGRARLGEAPGIGVEPDLPALRQLCRNAATAA